MTGEAVLGEDRTNVAVEADWFGRLLGAVEDLDPVVEVGAGPGFLKEFAPHLVATRRPLTVRELWNGWCRVAVDGLGRRAGLGLLGGFAVAVAFLLPYAVAPLGWVGTGLAAAHLLLTRLVRLQLARAWGIDDRLAWLQPLGALFAVAVLLRAALAARTGGARVEWRGRDYAA